MIIDKVLHTLLKPCIGLSTTGALVCAVKELLPEFDGVERIHVDTIHSVLKYKRDRDKKVDFVPPSGFRKYDLVLCHH